MPGRLVIGADSDAERPVVALVQAHRHRQPGRIAVGRHDQPGVVLLAGFGGYPGDAAGPVIKHRPGHGDALRQPGAGLLGVPGQDLIEVGPLADQAVAGIARQVRPVELDPAAAADDPQALVPQPAVTLGYRHAHPGECLDRARRQAVATDLFPRDSGSSPAPIRLGRRLPGNRRRPSPQDRRRRR